jgi:PAS domain S-box-containing protein
MNVNTFNGTLKKDLLIAFKALAFEHNEKEKRSAELLLANAQLANQNYQKEKKAIELMVANRKLTIQHKEQQKCAAKLLAANKALALESIAKEKQAALNLKNETQFKNTFNTLLEGIQIHDFNWRYIYVNDALVEQSTYTREELLGHTPMELYPGIKETEIFKAMQKCMTERIPLQLESDFIFPNGRKMHFELRIQPVPEGISVLSIDRTEKEKAKSIELQLQYDRQNFTALINTTSDFMWSVDRSYRLVSFNQPLENLLNLMNVGAPVKGTSMLNFAFTPEQEARFKDCYQRAFNGNSFTETEHNELAQTWVEISYYPVWSGTEIIGVACHSHDITDSKKAMSIIRVLNENMTLVNEQLLTILNTLPANIGLLEKDGVIISVNQAWKQFAIENGMGSEKYGVGENYITICELATGACATEALAIAEGVKKVLYGHVNSFALEYACHAPSEKRWHRVEVSPLDKGLETGAVVMHINITERKLAEDAIIELNNELENRVTQRTRELMDANTSLEAFSYSVSHDLRSPVRSIMGFSKLIMKEYGHTMCADQKDLFSHIENNGRRMNSIIEDLLMLCKTGAGNLNITQFNLTSLFHNVWENILIATPHNATLDLPQLPCVCADGSMLQQVLINLLGNAIKYSGKKEKPIITVGYSQTPDITTIWIKDNGAGFDMKFYDRLFEAFQRLHGFSEFEGTGVGLALIKRIIDRHGGQVWAEGVVGEGATFYFTLPRIPIPHAIALSSEVGN